MHLIQVIENAEFHSSDESSDEEEAVKAGQVISESDADSQALLVPGQGGLVPQRDWGGGHREESPPGGQVADAGGRGEEVGARQEHSEGLLQGRHGLL